MINKNKLKDITREPDLGLFWNVTFSNCVPYRWTENHNMGNVKARERLKKITEIISIFLHKIGKMEK